jgi:hypothetical protein
LMRTSTVVSVSNPPVSSRSRSAPMTPDEVKVPGRQDSWLRTVQRDRCHRSPPAA